MSKIPFALLLIGCSAFSGCFGSSPLLAAAQRNDAAAVRRYISRGDDVNARPYKATALQVAAEMGHLEIARMLLDAKADPNASHPSGYTALALAVQYGGPEMTRLLLERGAAVDPDAMKIATILGGPMLELLTAARDGKPLLRTAAAPAGPAPAPAAAASPAQAARIKSDVDRVPSVRRAPLKNAYALVLGVETYREKLPKADYAANDAKLMGEYLTSVMGFPEENVVVRTDDNASLTDFIKYVENWLPNNVEKDAKVFVYFSGHGAPNPKTGNAYLVPFDGDPTFIESTGYPVERLYAALDKLPTDDVSVVLDSCFSGAGGRSVLAKGARPLVQVVSVTKGTRASVLSAGASDQISNAYEEKGHGLLTYFLLKAFGGEGDLNKDGAVTLAEAHEYARPNVQRVARKFYNNEQTPQFAPGKPR